MMDELISRLLDNGIFLSKKGDKLDIEFDGDSLPDNLLEEIRKNKDQLLEYIGRNKDKSDYQDILPATLSAAFPLSSAQYRLWVLCQFEEASVAYNMPCEMQLADDVDIENFTKAINSTIERHEVLRTVFRVEASGEIKQWVLKAEDLNFKVAYEDFRNEKNKEEKVKNYITKDSGKAFDLASGPLLRAALLQTENKNYIFYYNMHHIISDGWSMDVVSRDVLAYYKAYKAGKEPALNALSIQYKDYSAWQLAQLESDSYKSHRAYWLERLSGKLPVLDLPTTKQRPRLKTHNGRTLGAYLNKELSYKLKEFSRQQGGTLFMSLLASFHALLYRYTGQNDQIVGTPVAGREHANLADQIGFYVNTLALRNEIDPKENFEELFSRVKQNTLKAYAHQMYPFDRLVEELNVLRDASRSAVFDVMLVHRINVENSGDFELTGDLDNKVFDYGLNTSKFDLLISVQEQGPYVWFAIEYNTDVYEGDMIERFIHHYKNFISQCVFDPTQAIGSINYLSEQERNEVLVQFNDTQKNYSEKTVMALFEEQVAKTPEKPALIFGEETLTYRELNERSNVLAHSLKKQYKADTSTKIGVMLERSLESVIAMIGVMKTGACYVPLDHDYPTERVNYILEDSSLKIIVGSDALWKKHCITVSHLVDLKKMDLSMGEKGNLRASNHPDDGSYVIYTSGSTGKPKGVLQTHRMMSNLIQWDIHHSNIQTGLKYLQYASFSFDASLHDLYFVLSSGGSAYIVPESSRLDYPALKEEILANKVEVLSMPFSALNAFCLEVEIEKIKEHAIKYIVSTAEQLYVSDGLKIFLENNPLVELHNHYGPSETHVVTSHYMSAALNNIESRSTIGKPISNSWIYILDELKNPVPKGVTGELYIGGDNLALGYLNKEALTQERFVKDPFKPGALLYKTGDQGYWRTDGTIEFIGRKDDQVKIRGYRIELGEIENVLLKNEQIKEAVVLARTSEHGEKELVAYITSATEQNTNELRSYLKEKLPEYMLPAYFVQLEVFPLTGNGKIDKKSLPDPQGLGLKSGVAYVAPRTETEEKIIKLWEELLQRTNIGINDDFFALGGHSLKMMRLLMAYKKQFNVQLSLQDVLIKTQLFSHAELIDIKNWVNSETRTENIEKESIETFNF